MVDQEADLGETNHKRPEIGMPKDHQLKVHKTIFEDRGDLALEGVIDTHVPWISGVESTVQFNRKLCTKCCNQGAYVQL